jgi:hypothetical protein
MERNGRSDPHSVTEAATFDGWKLRGAIDVVEEGADGVRRVTDHKTGAPRAPEGVVVGRGEVLQPVLYALAVESILGGKVSEARLWYCTSRGGFAERVVPMTDFARHYAGRVLGTIGHAIENGTFPLAPREGACQTAIGRCADPSRRRARKKDRALLEVLRRLRELPRAPRVDAEERSARGRGGPRSDPRTGQTFVVEAAGGLGRPRSGRADRRRWLRRARGRASWRSRSPSRPPAS